MTVTLKLEACEFVDLIADRLKDRWDYELADLEADAIADLLCGQEITQTDPVNYYADNYHVNAEKGNGADLIDSYNKELDEVSDWLNDCLFVWGRDSVTEILNNSEFTNEQKIEAIKELDSSDFGWCHSW